MQTCCSDASTFRNHLPHKLFATRHQVNTLSASSRARFRQTVVPPLEPPHARAAARKSADWHCPKRPIAAVRTRCIVREPRPTRLVAFPFKPSFEHNLKRVFLLGCAKKRAHASCKKPSSSPRSSPRLRSKLASDGGSKEADTNFVPRVIAPHEK